MQGSEAAPHSSQFLNFRGGVLGALQGVRCQVEQLFENSASFHVPPLPHPADKRLEGQGAHRVTKASSVLSSHTGQGFPAANTSLPRNVSKVKWGQGQGYASHSLKTDRKRKAEIMETLQAKIIDKS